MNAAPEAMVRVGDNPPAEMATLSLVLSAAGIDHQVDHRSGAVLVASGSAPRARAVWTTYQEEKHGWPPPPPNWGLTPGL